MTTQSLESAYVLNIRVSYNCAMEQSVRAFGTILISIVTPILNEEEDVEQFLNHLTELKGDFELILVEGGSSDHTIETVERNLEKLSETVTLCEVRTGRAVQMNAGAARARGEILLFLHADCLVPTNTLELIMQTLRSRGVVGGGFMQRFSDTDSFLTFVSNFGNLRSRLTKMFFGDSAIFLKKNVFDAIGGYGDSPLLEDVELCRRAKRHGKLVQIDRYVSTSPRRYVHHGRISLTAIYVIACFLDLLHSRPRFLERYISDR